VLTCTAGPGALIAFANFNWADAEYTVLNENGDKPLEPAAFASLGHQLRGGPPTATLTIPASVAAGDTVTIFAMGTVSLGSTSTTLITQYQLCICSTLPGGASSTLPDGAGAFPDCIFGAMPGNTAATLHPVSLMGAYKVTKSASAATLTVVVCIKVLGGEVNIIGRMQGYALMFDSN
jgi:hypothetical protein